MMAKAMMKNGSEAGFKSAVHRTHGCTSRVNADAYYDSQGAELASRVSPSLPGNHVTKSLRASYTRVVLQDTNRTAMSLPTIALALQCILVGYSCDLIVLLDELHGKALRCVPALYGY